MGGIPVGSCPFTKSQACSTSVARRAFTSIQAVIAAIVFTLMASSTTFAASTAGVSESSLPAVLTQNDIDLYKEIFSVQEKGAWKSADSLIAKIEDPILMGYVLRQRLMHPTAYRSSFSELKEWMAYYADHPEIAVEIHRLALKRRPSRARSPVRPHVRKWRQTPQKPLHPDLLADYDRTSRPTLNRIEGRVRYLARKKQALKAYKEIQRHLRARTITERQFDRMKSWIAASLYYQGYIDKAKSLAVEAANRNGSSAVLAQWIAGLIAFRENDRETAFTYFNEMAGNPHQEDDLRSAAGFWAARAALATQKTDAIVGNLEIAAAFPFTFYGQLALSQLGQRFDVDWSQPMVTEDGLAQLLEAAPRVRRAIALAEIGRKEDADRELRWINGAIEPHLDYDLLAVAAALDLPAAQIDIALNGDAAYLAPGLFPIPDYQPANGFETDRALIYALMRQESKFKTEATSRVGAAGLMQLMPRTASFIARDRSLRTRKGREKLYDPGYNLQIGQRYVNHLIETSANGDLFSMAVAYNGGPGNLRRWKRATQIEDPLLFIESIPNTESRDFVEKVLTNFWVYRARLGQATPTRDRVAAGELPLYEALDQALDSDADL